MPDFVEITLTHDRFESEILAESVRAEGFAAELLLENAGAAIGGPGLPSRLLVHAEDADAVREILHRSQKF